MSKPRSFNTILAAMKYADQELGRPACVVGLLPDPVVAGTYMVLMEDRKGEEWAMLMVREAVVVEDSLEASDFFRNGGVRGAAKKGAE